MDPLTILVVGGHPADTLDHCGGTMARHVRRGDRIVAVSLTHGVRVHDVVIAEELRFQKKTPDPERLEALMEERSKVKNSELIEALGILGVTEVRFLHHDDSILLVTHELVEAIAKVIREVKPHIIITHYPLEEGGVASHHGNTGQIVLYGILCAGNMTVGDPNPGHRVAQVFFMEPQTAVFGESCFAAQPPTFCDYFVDITDTAELKVKALDRMRSQQYGGDWARKVVEVLNGRNGHYIRVSYAEGFVRYWPEIGDYLSVSRERLERANEPEATMHARTDKFIAPFVELPED